MAYLILSDKDGEFDRRELKGPVTIGRALDCSICVRDILLSRKHCQIERFQDRWVIQDLGSKNGTRIGHESITKHILSDGDVIRMGKIQVSFHTGKFIPPPKDQPQRRRDVRPSDPKEALSGTVLGFQLFDMEADSKVSGFPIPKPKPPEPQALREEAVTAMVAQIASSSWDVAVADAEDEQKKPAPDAPPEIIERHQDIQQMKAKLVTAPKPAMLAKAIPVMKTIVETVEAPKPPAPAPHEEEVRSTPVIRSKDPNGRATIPGWLAGTYIALASAIGAASLMAIVMRSVGQ
jgi:hypothetical protein